MSKSEKPTRLCLKALSRSELEGLVVELLEEVSGLKQLVGELRAEVAELKGLKGRPKIKPSKPSGMEAASEKKKRGLAGDKPRGRGAKPASRRQVEDRIVKANVPSGSRFKGYEDFTIQDLVIQPMTIRFRRERWRTPDGRTIIAPLPDGIEGHFGSELRRFVLMQYYQGQVTIERLVKLLRAIGINICKRQLQRLLGSGRDAFQAEAQEVLRTGLAGSGWITVDDTGARHQAVNGYCTQIGNDHFAWFATTGSKSRLNFLELLRAGHEDYVINADALDYMRLRSLSGPVIQLLAQADTKAFADRDAWLAHLDALDISQLQVTPDPVRIATEAAIWGSIKSHGLLTDLVIVSDGAGQFNIGDHALCWVHAERLVHKLYTATEQQRDVQQRMRSVIWKFYTALKTYQSNPSPQRRETLRDRFDRIFRRRTGFVTLDQLLRRLHAQKDDLLKVLERPDIPLHTNGSENDIRSVVTKRKISGGTRSDHGRICRDTFLGLLKTCDKLGISFWDYLGARLKTVAALHVPPLPQLVAQRCASA